MELIMRFMNLMAIGLLCLTTSAFAQDPEGTDGARQIPADDVLVLELDTGTVYVELFADVAPRHVERIKTLAEQGFYDGIVFHRVIPGFMAQGGDPTGTGSGNSDLPNLLAEFSDIPHRRGIASMARSSSPNSANSQFFLMLADAPGGADTWSQLDGSYTVWGRVIDGMDNVDDIAVGEPPAEPTHIVSARLLSTVTPETATYSGPADLAERIEIAERPLEHFDPLFEDDIDIDILTPVLNSPN